MNRWWRLACALAPLRWLRSVLALVRGVRLHPGAVLISAAGRAVLGRGAVIGPDVCIDLGVRGRIQLGERSWLAAGTYIETSSRVQIGEDSTLQRRCSVNGEVRIGRGCILAPDVFISSGTHPFRVAPHLPIREQERRLAAGTLSAGAVLDRPVWVQDDCWLGVHAVVCPGVTIGRGSVVGANAVVVHDVPPYSVVAGTPARVIGRRLDWRPPARQCYERDEDAIYVLDGRSVPGGVALYAGGELVLAVPETATRVTLRGRCDASLALEVGEDRITLAAGDCAIEAVASTQCAPAGSRCVMLRRLDDSAGVLTIVGLDAQ